MGAESQTGQVLFDYARAFVFVSQAGKDRVNLQILTWRF
jgi:hypothetical protein